MGMSAARKEYYAKRLAMYLEAEERILRGQSYVIGSRSLTRANLAEVRAAISELENAIENNGVRNRTIRIVPRDL